MKNEKKCLEILSKFDLNGVAVEDCLAMIDRDFGKNAKKIMNKCGDDLLEKTLTFIVNKATDDHGFNLLFAGNTQISSGKIKIKKSMFDDLKNGVWCSKNIKSQWIDFVLENAVIIK